MTSLPGQTAVRLAGEFAQLVSSADRGLHLAAAQVETLKALLGTSEPWPDALSESLEVIVTDGEADEHVFVKLLLVPGLVPIAMFFDDTHEEASLALLERVRRTLDGRIIVWRASEWDHRCSP